MRFDVENRPPTLVASVAATVSEVEAARRLRCDATSMVVRMAVQARLAGLGHPVAAAIARAARVSLLAGPEEFAVRTGTSVVELMDAEAGLMRFGDLPSGYDPLLVSLGIDLLSLADLEAQWAETRDGRRAIH